MLAEVEEGSTTRVDARLRRHGGMVFRRLPAEVIETQLIRQSAAFKAKLKTLTRELKRALAWNRAAIQKDIEQVRKQLNRRKINQMQGVIRQTLKWGQNERCFRIRPKERVIELRRGSSGVFQISRKISICTRKSCPRRR